MKKQNGITLIALIITIILMLILAGVVISLTIGENGIFKVAKYAVQKNSEETAREKLELALADLQAHKYTNEAYNENEYINNYIENEGMQVVEDVVTVDGWRFKIDRSVPQIGESLGQEEVKVTKIVREYLGKNENGKYIAKITVIIESSKEIKSVVFQEDNGTKLEITPTEEKTKIAKDMIIELDKEYKIVINTTDGKSEEKTIIEKLPELGILISTPYVGTSSFTTKVQYVTNEQEVESYTYMLDEKEIITNANAEYTLENYLEPETTYNVKVIAKYKNGLTVESNVVTIKTEKRTYLYNNGDTCDEITGGWKAETIVCGNDSTGIKPSIDTNSNGSIYAYMISSASDYNYYGGSIKPVNEIDYNKYKKICFKMSASVDRYEDSVVIELYADSEEMIMIDRICGAGHKALNNEIVKYNINQIENIKNLYIYMQTRSDFGGAYCTIYEAWLEK